MSDFENKKQSRIKAREQAFALIFEKSINNESVEDILEAAKECREFLEDEDGYTLSAFAGTFENLELIDGIIADNLSGWTINRISKVSLAVLRLAIYEIKFMDEIPEAVSVNEAVELCKTYSTQDDASFVNGVLGTVVRAK